MLHLHDSQPYKIQQAATSAMCKAKGRESVQASALDDVPCADPPAEVIQPKPDSSAIAAEIATLRKTFSIARSPQVCMPSGQAFWQTQRYASAKLSALPPGRPARRPMKPSSLACTLCQVLQAALGSFIQCMCAKQPSSCSVRSSAQRRRAQYTGASSTTSMPLSFSWTPPAPVNLLLHISSSSKVCPRDSRSSATMIRLDSWRLACKHSALQARTQMLLDHAQCHYEPLPEIVSRQRWRQ